MPSRRDTLALLAGAAALSLPGRVAAQARLAYDLVPQPVTQDIWMIEGATEYFTAENGGAIVNCVLMRGESGLILIDSGPSLRYGEALSALARRIDLRGISAVINTHHHPDHFLGNQVFVDRPILSLARTRDLVAEQGDMLAENLYRLLGDWMRGTEPVAPGTVIGGGEITVDGRRLTALPLSGHTEADLAVQDVATGLLVAGDLAFLDRAPTTPQADLDWLETTLTEAARNGLDMVETMQTDLPAGFAAMGAMPQEFHRSVSHLFPGIERDVLPRAN